MGDRDREVGGGREGEGERGRFFQTGSIQSLTWDIMCFKLLGSKFPYMFMHMSICV